MAERRAELEAKIFQRHFELGEPPSNPRIKYGIDLKPTVGENDEVVWIAESESYQTQGLASYLIDLFLTHVEEEIDAHRA